MSDLIDTPRDRGNFEELARQADKIERLTAQSKQSAEYAVSLHASLRLAIDRIAKLEAALLSIANHNHGEHITREALVHPDNDMAEKARVALQEDNLDE